MTKLIAAVVVFFFILGPAKASDVKAAPTSGDFTKRLKTLLNESGEADSLAAVDLWDRDFFKKQASVRKFISAIYQNNWWSGGDGSLHSLAHGTIRTNSINEQLYPAMWKELTLRTMGMPKFGGLNKLKSQEFNVVLCWPEDEMPYLSHQINSYCSEFEGRMAPLLKQSSQELSEIGVIKYHFSPEPMGDMDKVPRVYIIPYKKNVETDGLKLTSLHYHALDITIYDGDILAGVRFTPSLQNQVDGFFVSDSNNNIKVAKCYIETSGSDKLITSYVDECLLRSAGIPNILEGSNGVLGAREKNQVTKISDTDIETLKILYDPSIIAGEDKYEVINKLLKDEKKGK